MKLKKEISGVSKIQEQMSALEVKKEGLLIGGFTGISSDVFEKTMLTDTNTNYAFCSCNQKCSSSGSTTTTTTTSTTTATLSMSFF